jgi:hypothetical protein
MGWFDTLPDWIKSTIQQEHEIEAIAWIMGKDIRQSKATDAEICASLYCAGLTGPMHYDACQIYLYICTRLLTGKGWEVPDDIKVTELSRDQERQLSEWRWQLYTRRGKAETPLSLAMKEVFGKRRCSA